jgi:Ca2+-transporting ATPase
MVVEETGARTQIGKIAENIQEVGEITPFQKQLKKFSNQLLIVVGIVIGIVFIVGILRKIPLSEIFITSVALAVSSIPEGLLVSLTIVLTVGMKRILEQKGLVRRLVAAETLGGVTVICVDKTGTLTEGNMQVSDYIGDANSLRLQTLLANDLDDPVVIAAYKWATDSLNKDDDADNLKSKKRIDNIPFSSKEKFSLYLYEWDKDKNMIFVNGAPEILLSWSTLSEEYKKEILQKIEELTSKGKEF